MYVFTFTIIPPELSFNLDRLKRLCSHLTSSHTMLSCHGCFYMPAGFVVESLFNAFATAAFFEFINFAIFEMQYLLSILRARLGPQLDSWHQQRELATMYIRFYGALLATIFVTYHSQRSALCSCVLHPNLTAVCC